MGSFLLTHVCSEEEVGHGAKKRIDDLPKKQGKLLNIVGDPFDEGKFISDQSINLSVLYCLYFFMKYQWMRWRISRGEREIPTLSWRRNFFFWMVRRITGRMLLWIK